MRKLFLVAVVLAAAAQVVPACSSDEKTDETDAGNADTGVVPPDICAKWTEAGAPCAPISNYTCFQQCTNGGCKCQPTRDSPTQGIWQCVTDLSCVPDAPPLETPDTAPPSNDAGDG
jgi:hypothetical protein